MWKKSYSIIAQEVTKEQIWKVWSDVNSWHFHDTGIEYAKLEGEFKKGNHFILKPKGGPKVTIDLVDVVENKTYTDVTRFPLARMWDEHTLEETTDGLKITNTIWVTGILAFLWIKIVASDIAKKMPSDIEALIQRAKNV